VAVYILWQIDDAEMAFNNSNDRYPKYTNNKNDLIHKWKAFRFQLSDKCYLLFPTKV